jgi:DNA polymerase III subunit gamma/tau
MAGDEPGTAPENPPGPGSPPASAPLALYRRYRPATFAEVRGQEHVTEPLRQALRNGRVHHAYLFSGPRGCGKTSSARILARSLNCVQGPTPDPCGVCESCVALAPSGPGSIDVIEIDAASHGGVDDARELRERAFYAPVSGRFKVYIIDEAHMVTREGFNALLKLVEEPPPHLKFVFATTEPEKVIATIRSRTHHYPFRLVPPSILRGLLEEILATESVTYEPTVLPLVVRAGAGSVRDSLSVLDQLLAGAGPEGLTYERTVALLGYTDDSLLDEMVDALAAGDGAAAFGTVDRVVQGGYDPRRFAADLLDRLRDLIILGAVPGAGQTGLLDAPADRLEKMADQAGRFGQADLARSAEILSDGLIQMRGTTSPRLLLELMVAQILLPGASTGEKALATRLERLERQLEGLASGGGPAPRPGTAPAPGTAPGTGTAAGSASAAETVVGPGTPRAAGRPSGQPGPPGAVPARGDAPAEEDTPGQENPARAREGARSARERPAPAAGPPSAGRPATAGSARTGSAQAGAARTGPAQAAPAQAGAAAAGAARAPARAAAPARPGVMDTETLRRHWPDVLEAVKRERRVAWILLNSASVDSLEGGVLTLAFNREGEAKGFATSGHDQVLTGVLGAMLGLNVRVRALAGTAAGSRGGGRAASADLAAPGGAKDGTGTHRAPRRAAQGRDDSPDEPGTPPGGPTSGSVAPGGRQAAKGGPASSPERGGSARGAPSAAPARPTGRETAVPDAPPPAARYDEEWPDDAGPAGGETGPTGMELIERQLGGMVIEEIEEP